MALRVWDDPFLLERVFDVLAGLLQAALGLVALAFCFKVTVVGRFTDLIWYGLGRSWLEAIRIDPTSDNLLGIPANIWAPFVAIALGAMLFYIQGRRHPEPEESPYRADRRHHSVETPTASPADARSARGSNNRSGGLVSRRPE